MFSYHPDTENTRKAAAYSSGWLTINQWTPEKEIETLNELILSGCTSPIIWGAGKRKEANFLFADWIALDFDEGLSLAAAVDLFKSFTHVIATTRSHQKAKGDQPPRDRFRVWLKLKDRCAEVNRYKDGMRALCTKLKSDPKAVDGARMFFPSAEVVSCNPAGKALHLPKRPPPTPNAKRPTPPTAKAEVRSLRQRLIPAFVMDWLRLGVSTGERNTTCFKIGAHLSKRGFDESEIVDILMNSSVPIDQTEATRIEVASAVRNGVRRAATER